MSKSQLTLMLDCQPNFSPKVGCIVSLMNISRIGTLNVVKNLNKVSLDHVHDNLSNSIGSILMHIAAMEYTTCINIFENRFLNKKELEIWSVGFAENLPKRLIRSNDLPYYINLLDNVRKYTMNKIELKSDNWLTEPYLSNNVILNNHFRLYHLVEDEISHRGQIVWLKKRLPNSNLHFR